MRFTVARCCASAWQQADEQGECAMPSLHHTQASRDVHDSGAQSVQTPAWIRIASLCNGVSCAG
ncbi:hypothetical protein XHV734_3579 [Xanthomonas hortorum pv. vitians]|nr:hypothetical protein XHV734_3579 [Xanthomonas hortorum pv. vitians]